LSGDGRQIVSKRLPTRARLSEEATRSLRDAVVSGDYSPGCRMAVDDLAHQLGVSTMPVREALVALANEGLLDVLPRRGYRVANISRRDLEDIFVVHALIAGMIAERAAQAITPETLKLLRSIQPQVEEIARLGDEVPGRGARIEQLNFEFHRTINRVPDAQRLRWFLRSTTKFVPRRYYELIPEWITTTMDDHPLILEALEHRDGEAAGRMMTEHVTRAGELVVAYLDKMGRWDATEE
jgi:DNA-binding GntR family transcriptional regulator